MPPLLFGVLTSPEQLLASAFHVQTSSHAWRLLLLPPKGPKLTVCDSKWTCRSWCSFSLNPPPTYLDPAHSWSWRGTYCIVVVVLQCKHCKSSSLFLWGVMFKPWSDDFFLPSARYLFFPSSESNGISSLWLPGIFLVDRSSQRKDKCQQLLLPSHIPYLWPEKISNICHKLSVFECLFVVFF